MFLIVKGQTNSFIFKNQFLCLNFFLCFSRVGGCTLIGRKECKQISAILGHVIVAESVVKLWIIDNTPTVDVLPLKVNCKPYIDFLTFF